MCKSVECNGRKKEKNVEKRGKSKRKNAPDIVEVEVIVQNVANGQKVAVGIKNVNVIDQERKKETVKKKRTKAGRGIESVIGIETRKEIEIEDSLVADAHAAEVGIGVEEGGLFVR